MHDKLAWLWKKLTCEHEWCELSIADSKYRYFFCWKCGKVRREPVVECSHSWHPRQQFVRDGKRFATYVCLECGAARDEEI